MNKALNKAVNAVLAALPALAMLAVIVSANSIASPCYGQPMPPKGLRKYRKF